MRVKLIRCYSGDNSNDNEEKVKEHHKNGSSLYISVLFQIDCRRDKDRECHNILYVVRKGGVVFKIKGASLAKEV